MARQEPRAHGLAERQRGEVQRGLPGASADRDHADTGLLVTDASSAYRLSTRGSVLASLAVSPNTVTAERIPTSAACAAQNIWSWGIPPVSSLRPGHHLPERRRWSHPCALRRRVSSASLPAGGL